MSHAVCDRCGLLTEWVHEAESSCISALRLVVDEMMAAQAKADVLLTDNQLWGTDDGAAKMD